MQRFSAFLVAVLMSPWTSAAEPDSQILFTNVNVFDGRNDELAMGQNVLVDGNLIKAISGEPIDASPSAIVIDGAGRTLMPGLIDGHAHVMINQDFSVVETNLDLTDLAYNATIVAKRFLMDGFTAVRDSCSARLTRDG